MKWIIFILPLMLFCSCSEQPVYSYYECNGVFITRIDRESDHFFYYGKFGQNDVLPKEYYVGKYRGGLDAVFSAYLIFKNDSVELINGEGSIEKIGINKRFYMRCDYEIKTNLDTSLYKNSSPYKNIAYTLQSSLPYDSTNYYHCSLIGSIRDVQVLERFIDSINGGYRFLDRVSGDVEKNNDGNYGNVVNVDHNIQTEISRNKLHHSKVLATYK